MFSGLYFFLSRLVYLALPVNLGELEPNFISYLFDLLVDIQAIRSADAQLQGITGIERANGGFRPVVFGLNC